MSDVIKILIPVLVTAFLQTIYFSYRMGRIEQKLVDLDARVGRLESSQDAHYRRK